MKPVDQASSDDCFAACIASILELPLEGVPNFCVLSTDWLVQADAWLRENYSLTIVGFAPKDEDAFYCRPAMYHVISGQGPRGLRHSVVGFQGKIAHDPHPSREGLVSCEDYDFLIPYNERLVSCPIP